MVTPLSGSEYHDVTYILLANAQEKSKDTMDKKPKKIAPVPRDD
jgi:hypothetical protein